MAATRAGAHGLTRRCGPDPAGRSCGDETVHLRRFSTDDVVADNDIDTTGLRRATFGEGVYIGSADGDWCIVSGCEPDHSDRHQVVGNRISGTSSESVDVTEGTTGGSSVATPSTDPG